MRAEELRELPDPELLAKAKEIRERLFNMSFKATTEPVTNPAEIRDLRKDVARIEGVLTERRKKGAPPTERLSRERRAARNIRAAAERAAGQKARPAAAKKAKSAPAQEREGTGGTTTTAKKA